ncbi:amidohydrolase [Bryobacter aggregatus]|uniref:amidohydrolase n=1 Tax=Bryobacter aggregatus TaxID=360054 RepID=UPI0009B5CB17|nr:amidohydrolase [Bryobacter aggregatus]
MTVFRLLSVAWIVAVTLQAQPADLIFRNAKVVTVDPKFRIAQAIAVRGDRIAAVGTDASVLRLRGPKTQVIDLGGKTVLPGLIDSHTHALDASLHEFDHEIPAMPDIAAVLAHVKERTKIVPEGEWIILRQVFITRLKEQRYPTRQELDEAAPRHPVIFSTGPDASLNSLGLQRNGITKATKSPEGQPGKVELDAVTGEPTGILRTYAAFVKSVPTERQPTDAERMARLKLLMADYNSLGITSITDRAAAAGHVEIYRKLRAEGGLSCRVFLDYHVAFPNRDWKDVEAEIAGVAADPLHKYDNMLWMRGIKVFLDGGMLTGSALMREPWGKSKIYSITDPEYRGMRYIDSERLYLLARASLKRELQFTAHTVGDGAIHALLNAYERVNEEFPVRASRPNLTHANFMSPEAVEKMAKLGVVADLQPAWLELDGATLVSQFGLPRMRYFQPYATLFKSGVTVGGGSDHMQRIGAMRAVNPYHPFWGMWIAIARQPRWTDQVLHPQERITREQAIRLYTINNAFLSFEEKEKGSLEVGKLADLIVLNRDILTVPVDTIPQIRVESTYLGGRQVYRQ